MSDFILDLTKDLKHVLRVFLKHADLVTVTIGPVKGERRLRLVF